jgi:RND superfamily putative drug exporter
MPSRRPPADEPQTTRLSTAKNAVRNAVTNAAAATRAAAAPPPPPAREEREIESWLGELRGTGSSTGQPTPSPTRRPSTESTRAMPEGGGAGPRQPPPSPGNEPTTAMAAQSEDADPTTAIPAQRPQDTDAATEKLNAADEKPKRRGGGMSAQDLLRREGRL